MDPKGHAAIVTGGGAGLGAETAAQLAAAGAKVALLDVNLDAAKQVASRIGGIAVRCDVADADGAAAALKEARGQHGAPRILINVEMEDSGTSRTAVAIVRTARPACRRSCRISPASER